MVRVKGGKPHKAMYTLLGTQVAKGILPVYSNSDRFNSSFFPFGLVNNFKSISVRFCPAQIHALEHLRPVLRVGATCTSMDSQQCALGVVLSREHSCKGAFL